MFSPLVEVGLFLPLSPPRPFKPTISHRIDHIPQSIQHDIQKSPLVIEHLALLDLSKNRLSEVPECVYLLSTSLILLYSSVVLLKGSIAYFSLNICGVGECDVVERGA